MGIDRAGFTGVTPGRQRCESEHHSQILDPMALSRQYSWKMLNFLPFPSRRHKCTVSARTGFTKPSLRLRKPLCWGSISVHVLDRTQETYSRHSDTKRATPPRLWLISLIGVMSHVLYLLIKSASGADGIWEQHILIRKSRICISERENERGERGRGVKSCEFWHWSTGWPSVQCAGWQATI